LYERDHLPMDMLETIVVGVLASLSASVLFLFAMYRLKPKIGISHLIAREQRNDKTIYVLKIVNLGKRPIVNLKAELVLVKNVSVEGGPMFWLRPIASRKDEVFFVSGYRRSDPNADYAFRVSTHEDLDALWDSESDFLELDVYAQDSSSGFGTATKQEFRTKRNCIRQGSHRWGKSLDVC